MKRCFECQWMGLNPSLGCKPWISASSPGAVQTSESWVGSQLALEWASGGGDVPLAQTPAELSWCPPPP